MQKVLAASIVPLALAGCATAQADPAPAAEMAMTCDAEPVQYHVGHTVTAAMGQAILDESGARQLRWAPPRSALTMDYRADRLTVSYDDDMVITQLSCG